MSADELQPHAQRRPDWAALVIALVLLILAGIITWDAGRMVGVAQYARIGPQTVPYAIALCLAALGVWTIVVAWRGDFPERDRQDTNPVLWIVGGMLVQLLTITAIGFSIATGLLFALVARGFGERRYWISLPFGLVLSLVVWFIFARGLSLTLPHGPVEDALVRLVAAVRGAP